MAAQPEKFPPMFIALGITFFGIAVGFLLRHWPLTPVLTRGVTPAIMLLLFALGVSVGGNEALMRALPRLGGTALTLTAASMVGSVACVLLIRRFFPRTPAQGEPAPNAPSQKAGKEHHEG